MSPFFELPEDKQPRDFARMSKAWPKRKRSRRTWRVTKLLGRNRREMVRRKGADVGPAGQPMKNRREWLTMLRGL